MFLSVYNAANSADTGKPLVRITVRLMKDGQPATKFFDYVLSDVQAQPVPHFGVVLEWADWHSLADRLRAAGIVFGIEPHIRFKGQGGEQATMFFRDPSGNALEFKAFREPGQLFATA